MKSRLDSVEQCLRSLVRHSLELAVKDHVTSIAFPAVGSGNLRFPQSTVAHAMLDEVSVFRARLAGRTCSLKNITFVVFPKDKATVSVRDRIFMI